MRAILLAACLLISACNAPPPDTRKDAPPPETGAAASEKAPPAPLKTRQLAGIFSVAVVPNDADPASFPDLARDACGANEVCQIGLWNDESFAPRGFPMTDREVEAKVFQYNVNRNTGFERSLWNCDVYPQTEQANCG